ncbi:MAG: DUF3618 domain-containing protein [Verrucomicrobiota bacterium]
MNNQEISGDAPRSSTEIEGGIRDTRKRMDETLDELSQRLTPRSLLNSAMDWWDENSSDIVGKSRVQKTYRMVAHQAKKHPAPTLLIGAGLAWLFLNSEDESTAQSPVRASRLPQADKPKEDGITDNAVDKMKEKVGEAKEALSGAFDSIKQKAQGLRDEAEEVKDKAAELYESGQRTVKNKLNDGMEQLRDAMDDYPLAIGAAFLALGALAGVMLPPTRREDSLLGAKSDELVGEIKEKGEELLEQGKEKATELGGELLGQAKEQGITAESVGANLSDLTTKAGEAVRHVAEEVTTSLKENKPTQTMK